MPKSDVLMASLRLWHPLYTRKLKADEAMFKAIEVLRDLMLDSKQTTQARVNGEESSLENRHKGNAVFRRQVEDR